MAISEQVINELRTFFMRLDAQNVISEPILPSVDNAINLGSAVKRFHKVYADEIVASNVGGPGGGATGNADQVDGFDAYATPTVGGLLAMSDDGGGNPVWPASTYALALLANGTRNLTGNLSVSPGVTIDGINVGSHNHTGSNQGVQLSHSNLSNLGNDDHTHYVHNTQARTITAQHSFSPGTATAPFALGANAQGQLVTGLNADKADGYDFNQDVRNTASPSFVAITATGSNSNIPGIVNETFSINADQTNTNSSIRIYKSTTYGSIQFDGTDLTLQGAASTDDVLISGNLDVSGTMAIGNNASIGTDVVYRVGHRFGNTHTWNYGEILSAELNVSDTGKNLIAQSITAGVYVGSSALSSGQITAQSIAVGNNGTGTVSSFGIGSTITIGASGGSFTTAMGLHVAMSTVSNTIGTLYGLRLGGTAGAAFGNATYVTNVYGLWINELNATSANKYAVVTQNGHIVLNDLGEDFDIRFESNNNQYMFFLDGGNDAIGIGTNTPAAILHIKGTTEQLRLEYDATHLVSFTVSAAGALSVVSDSDINLTPDTNIVNLPSSVTIASDVLLQRANANILALGSGDSFRSSNYSSGVSGWAIDASGFAEFENVFVRGELHASVFVKDMIDARAGTMLIAKSAGALSADMTVPTSGTWTMTVNDPPGGGFLFANSDICRCKTEYSGGVTDIWFVVSARTDNGNGTQSYTCTYSYGDRATQKVYPAGAPVVDYGVSGQGVLVMTAELANAPYYDVQTHAGSPWTTSTVKVRLGNLAGITDATLNPTGYGLYTDNAFLRGALVAGNGNFIVNENNITVLYPDIILDVRDAVSRRGKLYTTLDDSGYSHIVLTRTNFDGTNLLTNPEFTGNITNWTVAVDTDSASTGAYDSTQYKTSAGSFKASIIGSSSPGENAWVTATSLGISATAGNKIFVSGWIKIDSVDSASYATQASIYVVWINGSGSTIREDSICGISFIYPTDYDWTKISGVSLAAPATTASMKMKLRVYRGGTVAFGDSYVWFDDLHLENITEYATIDLYDLGVLISGKTLFSGELIQGDTDYGAYQIQTGGIIYANDYIVGMGGVHVGGTSDPGTDNLIVDGTLTQTGEATFTADIVANDTILAKAAFSSVHGSINASEPIRLVGSVSDAIIAIEDGAGDITLRWNASYGGSPTYLVSATDTVQLLIDTDNLKFNYASGSGKTAGDAITWETKFLVNKDGDAKVERVLVVGDTTLSSTATDGDIQYTGDLRPRRGGTNYTAYAYVPVLTSVRPYDTNGNQWAYSGTKTVATYSFDQSDANNSSLWPANAKALYVRLSGNWSSASSGSYITMHPRGVTSPAYLLCRALVASINTDVFGIVPLDANGDFDAIVAGATVNGPGISILGYFI